VRCSHCQRIGMSCHDLRPDKFIENDACGSLQNSVSDAQFT
jgi:hypothetical protein